MTPGELDWLAVILAGASLIISIAVLFAGWRILRSTRRSEEAGNERLEMLREHQERLKLMYQEREMLQEELERLRSAMDEEERARALDELANERPRREEAEAERDELRQRLEPLPEAPESRESPGPTTETPTDAGGGPERTTERRWWEFWR